MIHRLSKLFLKQQLIFGVAIYLISGQLTAQEKRSPVNFPTPKVANLGQYGETPVGHFTGTPNISIPIYTIQEGDIKVPVSLNYHPASVRVNNQPGWVGLGWSLIAGGSITRTQRGMADETRRAESGHEPGFKSAYAHHQLYNNSSWHTKERLKEYAAGLLRKTNYNWEAMADEFNFNFMGYSGKFYWGANQKIRVISDQPIKVELVSMIDAQDPQMRPVIRDRITRSALLINDRFFNQFKITTPDGKVYWFGGEAQRAIEYSVPYRGQATTPPTATTWHLVKITSPTGREVNFKYEAEDTVQRKDAQGNNIAVNIPRLNCSLFQGYSYKEVFGWGPISTATFDPDDKFFKTIYTALTPLRYTLIGLGIVLQTVTDISSEIKVFKTQDRLLTNSLAFPSNELVNGFLLFPTYLSKIEFSRGTLDFETAMTRTEKTVDAGPGLGKKIEMTSTQLRYPDAALRISGSVSPGSPQEGPYQYMTPKLAELGSYERSQVEDADNGHLDYVPQRGLLGLPELATRRLQWHQLNKITISDYEGVPIKEFYFDYTKNTDTRLKLLSLREVGKTLKTSNPGSLPHPTPGGISTSHSSKYLDYTSDLSKPPYKFFYNSRSLPIYCSDQVDHWGYHNDAPQLFFDFNAGKTLYKNKHLIIDKNIMRQYVDSRKADRSGKFMKAELLEKVVYPTGGFTKYEYEPHRFSKVVNILRNGLEDSTDVAGGVRIKRINSYTDYGKLATSKEYYYVKGYTQNALVNNLPSSGILASKVQNIWNYAYETDNHWVAQVWKFSSNNTYLAGFNTPGNHIGYSEVVEVQKDAQGNANGYTKYTFTNFDKDIWGNKHLDEGFIEFTDNYSIQHDLFSTPYLPFTSKAMERGLPTSVTLYNNQDQPVKSSLMKYAVSNPQPDNYLKIVYYDIIDDINYLTSGHNVRGTAYKVYDYNYHLVAQTVVDYSQGNSNDSLSTQEFFIYNQHNLLTKSTKHIQGHLEKTSTQTKYVGDYSLEAGPIAGTKEYQALKEMQRLNMVGIPIETITTRNGKAVGGAFNTFQTQAGLNNTTHIYPYQTYRLQTKVPLTINATPTDHSFSFGYALGNGTLRLDNHYTGQPEMVYNKFDDQGHVLEYYTKQGHYTNYLWGGDYPVAKTVDTQPSLFWFNGFEHDTHKNVADQRDLDKDFKAHTGFKAWNKGNYTFPALNTNANTRLSYWYYLPSDNQWHFSGEKNFSNTINQTGASMLDDIRVYQKGTWMTSYTYRPLVGLTSQTTVNNKPSFYQYDAWGRLLAVRDYEGNIVKKYTYKYRKNIGTGIVAHTTKCTLEGNKVTFTTDSPSNGEPTNYIWDFGDGSPKMATSTHQVDHTYAQAGTYQVQLTLMAKSHQAQTFVTYAKVYKPLVFTKLICNPRIRVDGSVVEGSCQFEKCDYNGTTPTNLYLQADYLGGAGETTYKWYISTTGQDNTWTQIAGANTFNIQAPYQKRSYWIKCEISDGCGATASKIKQIIVTDNGTCPDDQ